MSCGHTTNLDKLFSHAARHATLLHASATWLESLCESATSIDQLRLKHGDIIKKAHEVETDVYKIKGYMRLLPLGSVLAGKYRCSHVVSDLVGLHFKKRYPAYTVITWNETRCCGAMSFGPEIGDRPVIEAFLATHPLEPVLNRRSAHFFNVREFSADGSTFLQEIFPSLLTAIDPSIVPATISPIGSDYKAEWEAFYDTQAIESRIDYKRAMSKLTKKHLVAQVGLDSIEAKCVYYRITKDQKRLDEF
jgi:hypothetical protein